MKERQAGTLTYDPLFPLSYPSYSPTQMAFLPVAPPTFPSVIFKPSLMHWERETGWHSPSRIILSFLPPTVPHIRFFTPPSPLPLPKLFLAQHHALGDKGEIHWHSSSHMALSHLPPIPPNLPYYWPSFLPSLPPLPVLFQAQHHALGDKGEIHRHSPSHMTLFSHSPIPYTLPHKWPSFLSFLPPLLVSFLIQASCTGKER